MSQQSTVSAFRAEAPKGDPCYGPKSKPTLRGPGLQIPLKDAAPSKRQPQSTSEDDESPSGRAESGTPNGKSSIAPSDRESNLIAPRWPTMDLKPINEY